MVTRRTKTTYIDDDTLSLRGVDGAEPWMTLALQDEEVHLDYSQVREMCEALTQWMGQVGAVEGEEA